MKVFDRVNDIIPAFGEVSRAVGEGESPLSVTGLSSVHKAMLALKLSRERTVLVITEDEACARRIADDINSMASSDTALVYPAKDITLVDVESVSREYEYARLGVLSRVKDNRCRIICASAEAVMQQALPPDVLSKYTLLLEKGGTVDTTELTKQLVRAGYSRCDTVEGRSQFSVRGSIIDIFPVQSEHPVRIELWDDEIDTISFFDTESQRRFEQTDIIEIPPALEVLFGSDEEFIEAINRLSSSVRGRKTDVIRQKLAHDADVIAGGGSVGSIDKYFPIAYDTSALIFDYIGADGVVMFSEYHNAADKARGVFSHYSEDIKLLLDDGSLCRGLEGYMHEFSDIVGKALGCRCIFADTFLRKSDVSFKRLISATAFQTAPWGGEMRQLDEDLRSFTERGYSVIVMAGSEKTLPIIASDLREYGLSCSIADDSSVPAAGHVLLMTGSLSSGYDFPESRTALITQSKAMTAKRRLAKKKKNAAEIHSLSDISVGDPVVHALYGIGHFNGITKIENDGVVKDYITIKYAGTDVLYVPVTQLDLVSRYIGPDDNNVKVNKLSSGDWQKTRARVKKAVHDMADELTELYARRSRTKGYPFPPDDDWQADFDGRFPYDETDDQLRCIDEIKTDMQKAVPMDRLLCGDVGFGKTEVAFRAVFKCIEDGKQCALLVPTTVLAWQHYQTALKRFEHFPFNIELLSRFRSRKEQTEILKKLSEGRIDLIIGTHRLVQKDVVFKDLGLAVIDEEQRFGVAQKERFKQIFAGIDVLSLSATPIPRTLNMAMSGIRDMSVIDEPPVDRYPVQTYVIEHDDGIILQAINKELRRGGQVYYIHNRIETIERCAGKLGAMLPDARIAVAHGQIGEERLSEIWQQVVNHEVDILVCTTIIETGVDVANVNTLIIEDADRMGLSQLYQLRGRVGRSNRRAFAYFTFRRGKVLTEIASKRLDAIREFTQFGSGFRVAVRDLEIRGAGSILGGRQHGHMEAVGYDMYLRLLSEALAEMKGEKPPRAPEECLVDLRIEAHIPDKYITGLSERLDAYRKIAAVRTPEESMDLIDEFIDRYGDPPKSILGLITVALVRNMAGDIGITEITQRSGNMVFVISYASIEQVQALVAEYKDRVTMNSSADKPYISIKLDKKEKTVDLMKNAVTILYNSREKSDQ